MLRLLALLALLPTLAGCLNSRSTSGVEPSWRSAELPAFEVGRTTRAEVADALGPPSQLVVLDDGVAFYYLARERAVNGLVLILYNRVRERIDYDRAIYFFDADGVLVDFAVSEP